MYIWESEAADGSSVGTSTKTDIVRRGLDLSHLYNLVPLSVNTGRLWSLETFSLWPLTGEVHTDV
jgi:hypothetical protein